MPTTDVESRARMLSRQQEIMDLEPGDSVSIARRIHLSMGLTAEQIAKHVIQFRGIMDKQVNRARHARREHVYTVETGSFITRDAALIITVVATRVG